MAKSSSQMKNMVEEYLKTTSLKYRETTTQMQSKNPKVEWQFLVGNVHITKTNQRDDRIIIHCPILFGNHADKFNKLSIPEKFNTINQINQFLTLKGISANWVSEPSEESKLDKTKPPNFKGLNINGYIDEQELERPFFYRTFDSINACFVVANNLLSQKIRPETLQDVSTDDQPKGSMFQ